MMDNEGSDNEKVLVLFLGASASESWLGFLQSIKAITSDADRQLSRRTSLTSSVRKPGRNSGKRKQY